MWQRLVIISIGAMLMAMLAACREQTDGAETPTPAPFPTLTPTEEALLPTSTRTPTITATSSRTATVTSSPSPSRTATLTATVTASNTATRRPTRTDLPTETPSNTPTATRTPSLTATPSRTSTPTRTPSDTQTPTATNTDTPTASPSWTETRRPTPLPTIRPTLLPTDTASPTYTASPDLEESADTLLTPIAASATTVPLIEEDFSTQSVGQSTEIGPDSTPGGTPLPFASVTPLPAPLPLVLPTPTPIWGGGGAMPASGDLVVATNGVITTLDGRTFGSGYAFDFGTGGQSAIWRTDNQIVINGQVLLTGPVDVNGVLAGLSVSDMQWSPDGRFLAIVTSGKGVTDYASGIWIYDAITGEIRMIMKNVDERRAFRVEWTPNSSVVVARLTTPNGGAVGAIGREHTWEINFWVHPFEDATWATDGVSLIVSGMQQGNGVILGRVRVTLPDQPFEGYSFGGSGVNFVRAATELYDGRLAFLGSASSSGPFYLYLMQIGAPPVPVSQPIEGWIVDWEWNANRSGLMVITDTGQGRRLWVVSPSGATRDMGGAPAFAHWR